MANDSSSNVIEVQNSEQLFSAICDIFGMDKNGANPYFKELRAISVPDVAAACEKARDAGIAEGRKLGLNSELLAAARAEGHAAGLAEGKQAAIDQAALSSGLLKPTFIAEQLAAERARILKIQKHTEPGLESLAEISLNLGHSFEQFCAAQVETIRDRGITLSAIRADSKGAPHAAAPDPSSGGSASRIDAAAIFDSRKQAASGGK